VPTVEIERRLVKSPLELWDELASETTLSRWLGEVRMSAADPPHWLEWHVQGASGVIELESSGWGTKIRVLAEMDRAPAWERMHSRYALERSLRELLDDLGSSSLRSGDSPRSGGVADRVSRFARGPVKHPSAS
jgi:hypothetical protein